MSDIKDTRFIAADAVRDEDLLLDNNNFLRGRNQAGSADVNVLKIDTSNRIQLGDTGGTLPIVIGAQLASDPAGVAAGLYYSTTDNKFKFYNGTSWGAMGGSDPSLLSDGTVGAPAYSFASDPDTGMYRGAANDLRFAAGGAAKLSIQSSNALLYTPLQLDTGNTISLYQTANDFKAVISPASTMAANTLFKLPPDNGTAGYLLRTDGTGVTTWIAAPSGGANTNLSNLDSPTAIDEDLRFGVAAKTLVLRNDVYLKGRNSGDSADIDIIKTDSSGRTTITSGSTFILFSKSMIPDTDNSFESGTSAVAWSNVTSRKFTIDAGGSVGEISPVVTTPSGFTNTLGFRATGSKTVSIFTANEGTADALATKDLLIETGNKTAGTGGSGNIINKTGTSAGGSRGKIIFKDGSEGTTGHVWTSSNTTGSGYWAAGGGGITWSTAVNASILPDFTNTYSIGSSALHFNNMWNREYIISNTSTSLGRWLIGSSTPSGIAVDTAIVSGDSGSTVTKKLGVYSVSVASGLDTGRLAFETGNNTGSTGGASGAFLNKTGNVSHASNTANSGTLDYKSGDVAGSGNSGKFQFTAGTVNTGVRGGFEIDALYFKMPSAASAPASPVAGWMYYDTTNNKSYTYDGSAWQAHW
jgi:hypothetical protein